MSPILKTLVIRLADVSLEPLGPDSTVANADVSVSYDREVFVDGAWAPQFPKVLSSQDGEMRVQVLANDDSSITRGAGFGVVVHATLNPVRGGHGTSRTRSRTITVDTADADEVQFGAKPDATPVPPIMPVIDAERVLSDAKQASLDAATAKLTSVAAASSATQATELMAQWTAQAPLGGPAAQVLAAYRQYGNSNLTVGIVGDTTWARQWSKDYGQALPSGLSRTYGAWSGSSWQWTQDSAGSGGTPATGGVLVRDAFDRSGAVVGSMPDTGGAWQGATGAWAMSSGQASATANGVISQRIDGVDQDHTYRLKVTTAQQATARLMRLYVGAGENALQSGVWVSLSVSTTGLLSASLLKTVSGATTTLQAAKTVAGVASNQPTAQTVDVAFTVRSGTVTATVLAGGQTTTLASPVAAGDLPGPFTGVWSVGWDSSYPYTVDEVALGVPYVAGSPAPGITWLARSGLSTTDLAAAFPSTPRVDVLIVAAEQAAAASFVAAFRALPGQSAPVVLVASGQDVAALTMPVAPAIVSAQASQIAAVAGDVATIKAKPVAGLPKAALERFRALKAFGAGQLTIAVVSDSTGNDATDWPRVWDQSWGGTLPAAVRRTYNAWDATTSAWRPEVVDAAGAAPDYGVVLDDDFSTVGELVGSTPDSGPAWTGTAGGWVSGGSVLKAAGGTGGATIQMGSKDGTLTATMRVVTAKPSAVQAVRLYFGGVWANVSLSTSGVLTIQPWFSAASSTSLASASTVSGVTANSSTPQTVTVSVQVSIQQVTITATAAGQATTVTATITEDQYASQSTTVALSPNAGSSTPASYPFTFDSVHAQTPARDNPSPPPTVTMWNGSVAGAGLPHFDAAKRAAMFGGKNIDVLVLSIGHNNKSMGGPDFVKQVSEWVAAWRQEHPESAVLVSSQNPEFAPAATRDAHAARQAALRMWAKDQGHDYLPAYEAFAAKADGGKSLVLADGIHPTTPPVGSATGDYGAVLWADALTQTIG